MLYLGDKGERRRRVWKGIRTSFRGRGGRNHHSSSQARISNLHAFVMRKQSLRIFIAYRVQFVRTHLFREIFNFFFIRFQGASKT